MAPTVFKIAYLFLALAALPQVLARPQASPPTDPPATDAIRDEALNGHNSFRALHGASPLNWNVDLAAAAGSWVSRCAFQHGGGQDVYGGTSSDGLALIAEDAQFLAYAYRELGRWARWFLRHRRNQLVDSGTRRLHPRRFCRPLALYPGRLEGYHGCWMRYSQLPCWYHQPRLRKHLST